MRFKKMQAKAKEGEACHRCGAAAEVMIKINYPSFDGLAPGVKYPICDDCWSAWGELLVRHDEEKMVFLKLAKERKCRVF